MFAGANGRPVAIDSWRKRRWDTARVQASVSRARVYDLRHTAATAALYDGVPLHDVHDRMGHGSILTTLSHYAHVSEEARHSRQPPLADQVAAERPKAEAAAKKQRAGPDDEQLDQLAAALAAANARQ